MDDPFDNLLKAWLLKKSRVGSFQPLTLWKNPTPATYVEIVVGDRFLNDNHATNWRMSCCDPQAMVFGRQPWNWQKAFHPAVYTLFVFGAMARLKRRFISPSTTPGEGLVVVSFSALHEGTHCEIVASENGTKHQLVHYVYPAHELPWTQYYTRGTPKQTCVTDA